MEKKKIKVCTLHERVQKSDSEIWMKLTDNFKDYLFVRNKDKHEAVDVMCDECFITANGCFIH